MANPNDASRLARDVGNIMSYDYTLERAVVAVKGLIRERLFFPVVPVDALANTTVAANVNYSLVMPKAGRVINAGLISSANVTSNATAYKVLSIHSQAGVALATQNTQPTANSGTGNIVVGTATTILANTTTDNSARFAAGDPLYVVTEIASTGVALGITRWYVDVEWEGV
jgi:hypothetical protein